MLFSRDGVAIALVHVSVLNPGFSRLEWSEQLRIPHEPAPFQQPDAAGRALRTPRSGPRDHEVCSHRTPQLEEPVQPADARDDRALADDRLDGVDRERRDLGPRDVLEALDALELDVEQVRQVVGQTIGLSSLTAGPPGSQPGIHLSRSAT